MYHISKNLPYIYSCKVCRKESSKRKTKYRCKGCIELFGKSVNLCVSPCFEKFHLNPYKYLLRKEKKWW